MGWGRRNARRKKPKRSSTRGAFDSLRNRTVPAVDPQLQERWDRHKTTQQNYQELGLAFDPNVKQKPAKNPVELVVPEGPGKVEPYLTTPEVINARELIMKHGDDYLAMWRDLKTNRYQHTRKKLQKMCQLYMEKYADRDPLFKPKQKK